MEQWLGRFVEKYAGDLYFPDVQITDIVEVMILTFLIYQVMVWIKNTKAWMLMKGIIVLAVFILLAAIFKMHTILYGDSSYRCVSAGTSKSVGKIGREEISYLGCSF